MLSAGYGKRLRPLTNKLPKCLVKIKEKPILEIWLEKLNNEGLGPYLINTHYLSEQVQQFVNISKFKKEITLTHEKNLLGTAGTLIKNIDFFQNQDGLLIHSDNYCLENFNNFILAHDKRPKGCLITMMTFITPNPSSCGIVEINADGIVKKYYEKIASPPGNLANCAIYILTSEFLKEIVKNFKSAKDFSTEILPNYVNKIYTYQTNKLFADIGTPQELTVINSKNLL